MTSPPHLFRFQSTPPSREVTPIMEAVQLQVLISIHTSLAGGDGAITRYAGDSIIFQSTPPSREVTRQATSSFRDQLISIHTSLAGGDRNYA